MAEDGTGYAQDINTSWSTEKILDHTLNSRMLIESYPLVTRSYLFGVLFGRLPSLEV